MTTMMLTNSAQMPAVTMRNPFERIVGLALDAVNSAHTRRAYERALGDFLTWYEAEGRPGPHPAPGLQGPPAGPGPERLDDQPAPERDPQAGHRVG